MFVPQSWSSEEPYKYCYGKTKSQEAMAYSYFDLDKGVEGVKAFPATSKDHKAELIAFLETEQYKTPFDLNVDLYGSCVSRLNLKFNPDSLQYCFFLDWMFSDFFFLRDQGEPLKNALKLHLASLPSEVRDYVAQVAEEIYETDNSEKNVFLYDMFYGCSNG